MAAGDQPTINPAIADERGEPLVVLEGSPDYYSRFGFVAVATHSITLPLPDWATTSAHPVADELVGPLISWPVIDQDVDAVVSAIVDGDLDRWRGRAS